MNTITPLVVSLALAATLTVQSALHAQEIQPAADGTGTIVNPAGSTFNITGGTTSSSGANLFQSFTNFGLSNGQVANFLSAPNTQNILSRVTGGNFSLIDGLLKVTGSNANLFLVNPSGIVFGPNASLNVPAAFMATTANGVAFGSQWFNALGQNNYASLNGSPSSLGFTMSRPGAIINAGNLSVGPGQALSLIGGTVASTGQLSGGQVTLAAVPGEHYVRLGQPGSPLSIEVPISGAQMPTNWDLPIYSLPELLTGTGAGLTVADDGTVKLVGSQLTVENGDVVARKIDAASAVLSASRNVTLPESQLETTKDLLIQAKDTVTARDSKENSVLVKAGGNLTIQGDKSVDLLALNHPGQAFQSGADLRLVSDGNVSGDAHFGSGGRFSIENLAGKPGNFVSLYDPIISSGNNVSFGDYTGVSLKVESGGSITGGNITITNSEASTAIPGNDADFTTLTNSPALILRAGVTSLGNAPLSFVGTGNSTTFTSGNLTTSPGNITVVSLNTGGNVTIGAGPIILEAPGNISVSGSVNAGNLTVNTPGAATFSNSVSANNFTTDAGGLTVLSGNVTTLGSQTFNDNVQLNGSRTLASTGAGNISFGGTVNAGQGGNITVNTAGTTTFNNGVFANNLTTDAGGLTVLSGNVKTVLNQTYNDNVQLNNSLSLGSAGAGSFGVGGNVSFGGTVNSQPEETNSLTVNTNGGNVTLNGPVGNTQPLGNLTVSAGNISLAGIGTTTQAGVTGNTDLQAPGGTITFTGNTYNANAQNYVGNSIAVNAGNGTATFTASSDPITFQGPIVLNNSGLTIIGASTIATRNIGGTGPINFTAASNINTGNIATNGQSIALTSLGGTITAGTINSSTANGGAPITLSHKGNQFIVNGSPGVGDSSSGNISSRSNNVIPSGSFTGNFNQGDIAIIGPKVSLPPVNIPPETSNPTPTPTPPITEPPTAISNRKPSLTEPSSPATVRAFENYFEESLSTGQSSIPQLQDDLRRIEKASGKKLAIINVDAEAKVLTLITPEDNTIVAIPLTVTSEALREKATELRREIADPSNVTSNRYLTTSRQLYGWLIAPLESYLQAKKVNTLIFQLDAGLRLMPLAALNNGQNFLVEKYSISIIPSVNLLDTRYEPERVRSSKVLAMGAASFKDDVPLPAVPTELQTVTQETGGGSVFLNENFTLANLKAKNTGFGIIHLATHADFNRGAVQNSYIKLNDTRLGLKQMRDLGWNQQNVELLVLSACRTAFGDVNTELGFAGLAVGAGVKTAVATLWRSSDLGTFGLMSEFYSDLKTASIKADALRSAQVAMLRGEVRIENGQLRVKKNTFPLPADLKALGEVRLTHPYYWSGFTMIGSPW
jgi:filamentous hemagglutinin family protein